MYERRIGILTSGGDCPGLNAVLRGVTKAAEKLNWQVIGFRDGFEGLLPPSQYTILDRASTAASHKRAMVLEVMGRHAGWIALHGGVSGGADIVLLPEIPFDWERVADVVRRRDAEGYQSTMIVAAEGAHPKDGIQHYQATQGGEHRFGGIGEVVAREVAERTGKESRYCILGHLQRGGTPGPLDRILATRFGVKAVSLIQEAKFGRMVRMQYRLSLPV